MPYIKKPPASVSRTLQLEEPVSQLLDDYSLFVECTPDHVANYVLKKLLWRDPEYRKYRESKRAAIQPTPGNGADSGRRTP